MRLGDNDACGLSPPLLLLARSRCPLRTPPIEPRSRSSRPCSPMETSATRFPSRSADRVRSTSCWTLARPACACCRAPFRIPPTPSPISRASTATAPASGLNGVVAKIPVGIGGTSAPVPISVQLVRTIDCFPASPKCPASRLSQAEYGIGGDGLLRQGFRGIVGVGLAKGPVGNPLIETGAHSWIVSLPRPGQPDAGKLIIDPGPSELSGYVMLPISGCGRISRRRLGMLHHREKPEEHLRMDIARHRRTGNSHRLGQRRRSAGLEPRATRSGSFSATVRVARLPANSRPAPARRHGSLPGSIPSWLSQALRSEPCRISCFPFSMTPGEHDRIEAEMTSAGFVGGLCGTR